MPHTEEYPTRDLAGIRYLAIHHSGSPVDSSAEAIARYHVDHNGWAGGIGYHFLCHWDGRTEYVQDIGLASYNVAGLNSQVIGICLPGDWSGELPPEPALIACQKLVAWLRLELGRYVPVVGHKNIALPGHATSCPGATWLKWRERIA